MQPFWRIKPEVREVVALDESGEQSVALVSRHHRISGHQSIHLPHYRRRRARNGRHRGCGRHDNGDRCRRRRRMSSRVVIHVIIDDRQDVRIVTRLTAGHIGSDAVVSRTRQRRLQDTCGGLSRRGDSHVCVYVIIVGDTCRRRRRCRSVGFLMFPILNFIQIINGARIASTGHSVFADSGQNHSLSKTLLEPTILAAIALLLRYDALAVGHTRVHALVLHRALEEALTALARDDAVVKTCGSVLANHANHLLRVWLGVHRLNHQFSRRQTCRPVVVHIDVIDADDRRQVRQRRDKRLGVGHRSRRSGRRTVRIGLIGRLAGAVRRGSWQGHRRGRCRPHHCLVAVALTGNVAHKERGGRWTASGGQVETFVARTRRRAVVRIGRSSDVRLFDDDICGQRRQ